LDSFLEWGKKPVYYYRVDWKRDSAWYLKRTNPIAALPVLSAVAYSTNSWVDTENKNHTMETFKFGNLITSPTSGFKNW